MISEVSIEVVLANVKVMKFAANRILDALVGSEGSAADFVAERAYRALDDADAICYVFGVRPEPDAMATLSNDQIAKIRGIAESIYRAVGDPEQRVPPAAWRGTSGMPQD